MTPRIWTYGTLMRGHCRAQLLRDHALLGVFHSQPIYRLVDCGDYPGLIESEAGLAIYGELYQVDAATLARLDAVEGTPTLYTRRAVRLQDLPPEWAPAEAYFYELDAEGLPDCGSRWEGV